MRKLRKRTVLRAVLIAATASISMAAATGAEPGSLRQARLTHVQSPYDIGACYVWYRVTPWKESCSEVTREYCDMQNTITLGRRFVEGAKCPEGL